jgi:predicted Zn finger-like uncharacterized protein
MRLVCEKCSAVYTIEDTLVGDRDFRVSCKQCGTPIVRRTRADTGSPSSVGQITTATGTGGSSALSPRPPRPPASFAPTGAEEWFVWVEEGQRGPFQANQVAAMIEQGEMDWSAQVWREGFRDWRAARRDATLVTAVAGARGVAGDTMRLSSARSFLAPEDTIVESRADIFSPSQRISLGPGQDLLSSASDTQAIDARELTAIETAAAEPARPNLTPQPTPQQWNTPENAAFRAALGLRSDTMPMKAAPPLPVEANGSAGPTMASAFRSAPSLMRSTNTGEVTGAPVTGTDGRDSWLPKPQSLLAVAALAFAGGVLAAAIASRYMAPARPDPSPSTKTIASASPKSSAPAPAATPPRPPAPSAPLTIPPVTAPLRELPEPEELRAEVRRVAPDVRRCITDPLAGVEVSVFFDGPSGRVRDVHVRSSGLTAGRVDCVIHAVRQMQLSPFKRPELRLPHKFSWGG